jgi:hypothetical protein
MVFSASSRRYGDEKQENSWFRQDEAVKVKVSGAGSKELFFICTFTFDLRLSTGGRASLVVASGRLVAFPAPDYPLQRCFSLEYPSVEYVASLL